MGTIFGLIMAALCLFTFTTFGSGIINFIEEVCTGEDDSDPSMRSSGMTHSEFEQWLRDTCSNAPNHTVKYTGCDGPRDGDWLDYRFVFERGGWEYGERAVASFHWPLKHGKGTWLSKQMRS